MNHPLIQPNAAKAGLLLISASLLVLSGCAKETAAVASSEANVPASSQPAQPDRPLTRDEILARYDAEQSGSSAPAVSASNNTRIQPAVQSSQPTPPAATRQQQAQTAQQQSAPAPAPAPQQASARPAPPPQSVSRAPQVGTAECPAKPIEGRWMSQEIRQGSEDQVLPVAVGYLFAPDGRFATAMFDLASGEQLGEFEGRYQTKRSNGSCVVSFNVPNQEANDLQYSVQNGQLRMTDPVADSRAVLERL